MVQQAVDREVTSGNLERIINEQVQMQLRTSVSKAIEGYFQYGDGYRAIESAVSQELTKVFSDDRS